MSALAVLLVEDDGPTADLVSNVLRPWHDVLHVHANPLTALETPRTLDVALVDLDIQTGGGLALVHFFRARDPGLAIIALTPEGDIEAEMVAQALGVTATIAKPLTGDALLVALSPVRERKAARVAAVSQRGAVPLAPVLQAPEPRALAAALAEASRELTGAAARVVLEDASGGEVVAAAGEGALDDAVEAIVLAAHDETVGTLRVARDAPGLASGAARRELDLLALAGATVGVLLRRVDAIARMGIKDPSTSAYTFAYFVDVAGREIERARRHDRRFGLLTFAVENYAALRETATVDAMREARRELVDTILDVIRDTDVLACVEDDEMYLLVPETGLLGALSCRRRIAERQTRRAELARLEGRPAMVVTIGVATYPRDGRELTSLLRAAHKRGSAARESVARALTQELRGGLEAMLGAFLRFWPDGLSWKVRQGAMHGDTLAALASAVAREAVRGVAARDGVMYILGDRGHPLVRGAHDAAQTSTGGGTPTYWLRPRTADEARAEPAAHGARSGAVEIEIDGGRVGPFVLMVVLTEAWAYACVASDHGEYKRMMHSCESELVEALLAELRATFHLQRGFE